MKIQHLLCMLVIVLAAILIGLICQKEEAPEMSPIAPERYVEPRDYEEYYRDIDRELKEKDRRGIGHINPGDALKLPPGDLPPEY